MNFWLQDVLALLGTVWLITILLAVGGLMTALFIGWLILMLPVVLASLALEKLDGRRDR